MSMPWSHTVRSVMIPLTWAMVVTVLVGLNFTLSERHLLPAWASLPPLSSPRVHHLTILQTAGNVCTTSFPAKNLLASITVWFQRYFQAAFAYESVGRLHQRIQMHQMASSCITCHACILRSAWHCSVRTYDHNIFCLIITARVPYKLII
jgi:hypothetical protein